MTNSLGLPGTFPFSGASPTLNPRNPSVPGKTRWMVAFLRWWHISSDQERYQDGQQKIVAAMATKREKMAVAIVKGWGLLEEMLGYSDAIGNMELTSKL